MISNHIGIVILKAQAVAHRKTTTDVQGGQVFAYLPHLTIHLQRLGQLVPVVDVIADTTVNEEVCSIRA